MNEKTLTKNSISLGGSMELVHAAIEEAKAIGFNISVSIVDESGIEKLFARMDGAPLISVETALKKARLAVGFGISTGNQWYSFMKDDPILTAGASDLPGFILLGGGMPVFENGKLIGAIGISGGHYKQDEQCAKAAIDKVYGAD
jgi:uncharacterized protein GlcG (DUF336 family)